MPRTNDGSAGLRERFLRPLRPGLERVRAAVEAIDDPGRAWDVLLDRGFLPADWLRRERRSFREYLKTTSPARYLSAEGRPATVDACVAIAADVDGIARAEAATRACFGARIDGIRWHTFRGYPLDWARRFLPFDAQAHQGSFGTEVGLVIGAPPRSPDFQHAERTRLALTNWRAALSRHAPAATPALLEVWRAGYGYSGVVQHSNEAHEVVSTEAILLLPVDGPPGPAASVETPSPLSMCVFCGLPEPGRPCRRCRRAADDIAWRSDGGVWSFASHDRSWVGHASFQGEVLQEATGRQLQSEPLRFSAKLRRLGEALSSAAVLAMDDDASFELKLRPVALHWSWLYPGEGPPDGPTRRTKSRLLFASAVGLILRGAVRVRRTTSVGWRYYAQAVQPHMELRTNPVHEWGAAELATCEGWLERALHAAVFDAAAEIPQGPWPDSRESPCAYQYIGAVGAPLTRQLRGRAGDQDPLVAAQRDTPRQPSLAGGAAQALLLFCRECPELARELASHVGHANRLD